MKAGLIRRVEKLESEIDTSPVSLLNRVLFKNRSSTALSLSYEIVTLDAIGAGTSEALERFRRFCDGESVLILSKDTDEQIKKAYKEWKDYDRLPTSFDDEHDSTTLRARIPAPKVWVYVDSHEFDGWTDSTSNDNVRKSARALLTYFYKLYGNKSVQFSG